MKLDPVLTRPHHLLPHLPKRQSRTLPVGMHMVNEVIDSALPYGKRLILLSRRQRLIRSGILVA